MRIHEVEIYSSKQIYAFIEYLKVLAEEKKTLEGMQSPCFNTNMLVGGSIGSSIGRQYSDVNKAQAELEKIAAEKAEATNR